LVFSCKSGVTERRYFSPDSITGGFSDFSLNLNSDNRSFLVFGVANSVGETESGGLYEWQIDTVAEGNWTIIDNMFSIDFNAESDFIETVFSNNESIIINGQTIMFDIRTDTLVIKNIPCISSTVKEN